MWRGEGQPGEVAVSYPHAQHLSQLVDKAARAGGAGFVHLVINHNAVSLDDQLGILPAYLNDICLRVYFGGGSGLGRDFVLNQVGTDEAADQVSA
ncbi:hypothetical protein ES703_68814 [subsurface metagenome]